MGRRTAVALALALLAAPAAAKSRTSAAVDAANAAKAAFHTENAPGHPAPEAAPAPNRTLKVVIAAIEPTGVLVLESLDGTMLGTVDPRAVPELIAGDRALFGGRKHLVPEDLAPGQRLKLTFRGTTREVLKAKVLRAR